MTFYVHMKDTIFWMPKLYNLDRCVLGAGGEAWKARFEGALPVRLVVHDKDAVGVELQEGEGVECEEDGCLD